MKALSQFLITAAVFFLLWFGFSRVHWIEWLHIREFKQKKQRQLSHLVLEAYKQDRSEYTDDSTLLAIKIIRDKICLANHIDTSTVQIHVFKDGLVNAFAIPGGQMIINSSLVNLCDSSDMLAGVMAHEIAHIKLNHISKKLAQEIGLSTVIMATGGSGNYTVIKKILYNLSSTGFDRSKEAEADETAVTYLCNAGIDPKPLAEFLQKMMDRNLTVEIPELLNTHPATIKRVQAIIIAAKKYNNRQYLSALPPAEWNHLKQTVQ